ncbi:hypothetical protein D9611_002144 [Ephemerocybe angulata]|uniref:HTH CENPB-type domain-containing protein n=1 Tax=Ephemerocybe angulata TaxID=980116 RepID=A0A8H5CH93_9AGAR|nr:hypothetical protein D9611_002144 [Tulosesus angulatus]
MPRTAKPEDLKQRLARKEIDDLTNRAAAAYRLELDKPYKRGMVRRGSRKIADDFEGIYFAETGKKIKLSHNTVAERAKGRKSRIESAKLQEWLTEDETEIVISHIIRSANQGFPLSHRRLKEDVDRILRARLGAEFREEGVGQAWTHRFVKKHSDRLKMAWSTPLESKRANAVNPTTNEAWWKLLGDTLTDYSIEPWNIYGVDEVGCQPYGTEKERVIGANRAGPQYQQRPGNRENITVLVTICADGSSTPPAVIFKGKAYQVKWKQDNPANASCGLDVVIFAVLKRKLSSERDAFTRTNAADITKENFLAIYGRAHIATLTSENVKAAFKKTGVVPYNPSVVSDVNLAPSVPQSLQSNLPAPPPTPVRIMAKMLSNLSLEDEESLATVNEDEEEPDSPTDAAKRSRAIVEDAAKELANTNYAYLIGKQRVLSSSPMVPPTAQPILNVPVDISSLLFITPKSKNEATLLAALRELHAENKTLKHRVIELQASNILNETYCNKLRFQLAAKEEKAAKKGKGRGKLMGDGLPRMLSGDEFHARVVEFTEWQRQEELRKEKRGNVRALWKEEVAKWEVEKERIKRENELVDERNEKAEQKWKNAQSAAKRANRTFKQRKPVKESKEKVPKKPTLKEFEASLEEDDSGDDSVESSGAEEEEETEGEGDDEEDSD